MLVGFAGGLLLSLAFEGRADFPDALVPDGLSVPGCCSRKRL